MIDPPSNRNQVSNFIQTLLHSPSLHNPLRRSNSQKHIQDASDITPPSEAEIVGLSKILVPTPIKHRSKSDEKAISYLRIKRIILSPSKDQRQSCFRR